MKKIKLSKAERFNAHSCVLSLVAILFYIFFNLLKNHTEHACMYAYITLLMNVSKDVCMYVFKYKQ